MKNITALLSDDATIHGITNGVKENIDFACMHLKSNDEEESLYPFFHSLPDLVNLIYWLARREQELKDDRYDKGDINADDLDEDAFL